jgi:predicted CopG family antitoxin
MRISKSFTIEAEISNYLEETKGERSASDRVNELLRRAMIQEQYERLEAEAAAFFADAKADRAETREFQKASLRTFGRD